MQNVGGVLNLKNAACYAYPEENGCVPGDHFALEQKADAAAFASYKPYVFSWSPTQRLGNIISLATCSVVLLILLACGLDWQRSVWRRDAERTIEGPR